MNSSVASRQRDSALLANNFLACYIKFRGKMEEEIPSQEESGVEVGSGTFNLIDKFVADGEKSIKVHRFCEINVRPGIEDHFF